MGFFSKKNKKEKKGFFGKKRHEEQEEIIEPIVDDEPEEDAAPADNGLSENDIDAAISERESAVREEEERRRLEAEKAAEKERATAVALAAEAAQLAALSQDAEEFEELPEEEEETEATEEETIEESVVESTEEAIEETTEEAEIKAEPESAEETSVEVVEVKEETEPEIEIELEAEIAHKDDTPNRKSIFVKIRDGLRKTKDSMMSGIKNVLGSFTKIDEDLFDELEETMIMGDMGVETSETICNALRKRIKERGITDPKEIMGLIREIITEMLGEDKELVLDTQPSVIVVIGVNGAGKTTTIGKLCHQLKAEGKKVIVAAADTFRAAAIDQLEVWTERSGVEIVKHAEGSDPGAVVYDAIEAAKARDCDVLICDTAGRLHNKKNLMQELAKINRIIATRAEGCSVETLLVLDATTGQNAVNQARLFKETADISGIVLTKLDGTAKGGIIVSIKNELDIPVKLVGVGEKIDDLQPFHGEDFVNALFEREEK